MQTFLYNLNTNQREGPIRDGRYLVDGKPGPLHDFLVELEIVRLPDPSYDYATQTIEYREYADIPNKNWIIESYVRNLSQEEINQRIPGPSGPQICTPRQFRLALIQNNILPDQIETLIESIPDEIKKAQVRTEWEYALEIHRQHPYIIEFGSLLGLNDKQIDDLFLMAIQIN